MTSLYVSGISTILYAVDGGALMPLGAAGADVFAVDVAMFILLE